MDKSRAIIHFRQCGSLSNIVTKFDGIWLVIELGQEIMPTNNATKFDDDPLKNIQVKERTRFIFGNFG